MNELTSPLSQIIARAFLAAVAAVTLCRTGMTPIRPFGSCSLRDNRGSVLFDEDNHAYQCVASESWSVCRLEGGKWVCPPR